MDDNGYEVVERIPGEEETTMLTAGADEVKAVEAELVVPQRVSALSRECATLKGTIEALQVTDATSFEQMGTLLGTVNARLRAVDELFAPIDRAQIEARRVTLGQRKSLEEPLGAAKRVAGDRMATWQEEQERLRREAERAAERERQRLEDEERQRVERETAERLRDAETHVLEEAAALEAQGDTVAAARLLEAPVTLDTPVLPRPVFTPPVAIAAPPKVAGLSFRDNWTAEVTDLLALVKAVASGAQPITLLQANQTTLNGMARALKESMRVPGVRAVNQKGTTDRRR